VAKVNASGRKTIDPRQFVHLWKTWGAQETWDFYAEELGVEAAHVRMWVARNRERLREEHGIVVPSRRAPLDPELFPWPERAAKWQNQQWHKFLLRENRVRAFGDDCLSSEEFQRWVEARGKLLSGRLVVAYNAEQGYHTRPATDEELRLGRFAELLPGATGTESKIDG